MATYKGAQSGRAPTLATGSVGAWIDSNKITPSAALALNDIVVMLEVPAGVRLETLRFYGGDFDTGTTLTHDIGYRGKQPGSAISSLEAFANDTTTLRAATTAWQELVFEPVKFDEPVEIVMRISAAATGVSGTPSLYVQGMGAFIGLS